MKRFHVRKERKIYIPKAIKPAMANISPIAKGRLDRMDSSFLGSLLRNPNPPAAVVRRGLSGASALFVVSWAGSDSKGAFSEITILAERLLLLLLFLFLSLEVLRVHVIKVKEDESGRELYLWEKMGRILRSWVWVLDSFIALVVVVMFTAIIDTYQKQSRAEFLPISFFSL